jgi:protease I
MQKTFSEIKVLTIVDDIYEDLELWYPKYRLEAEGAKVTVAALEKKIYTGKHGYPALADALFEEVSADEFDAFLIPGGFMPDKLRRIPKVLELTKDFDRQNKCIAMICHAGWIPISAKILNGRTVTSTPGIRDDIENAGAEWIDRPVVIDRNIISARRPPDLPEFGEAIVKYLRDH